MSKEFRPISNYGFEAQVAMAALVAATMAIDNKIKTEVVILNGQAIARPVEKAMGQIVSLPTLPNGSISIPKQLIPANP